MYFQFTDVANLSRKIIGSRPSNDFVLMLFISDEHANDLSELLDVLRHENITFFGGLFPGLIRNNQRLDEGIIATWFDPILEPQLVALDLDGAHWDKDNTLPKTMHNRLCTGFVVAEFLSPGLTDFLSELSHRFGQHVNYFGAGAGFRDLGKRPAVFCNEGIFENAAIVALADTTSLIKVRHGWQHKDGPFIVTKANRNEIQEFNWSSALEIYLASVPGDHSGLNEDNFYARMSGHPLSFQKEGGEDVVRDPVGYSDDGSVVVLSDVPVNQVMYTVHAEPDWLIRAAKKVVSEVADETAKGTVLVSDCYSRLLRLEERFDEELGAAASNLKTAPGIEAIEGVMALGEIAASAGESIELYNKTFVACRLDEITTIPEQQTA